MPEARSATAPRLLTWEFPLPRTHTGVLLGNGTQGLMVWGGERLHVTVGRAGFWDHRGGNQFAARTTYAEVRRLLEAGDHAGLRRVFARDDQRPGQPDRPHQIGCGRLELALAGWRPARAALDIARASLRVEWSDGRGATAACTVRQAMDAELAWIEFDAVLAAALAVDQAPTWRWVGERLARVGVRPPLVEQAADHGGFCQELPEDAPCALAWRRAGSRLTLATALGDGARDRARALADHADCTAAGQRADAWWAAYWRDLPAVELPDAELQHAWDYGVYKQAGLTTPGAVPASLQGPWLEEYQLPPWSCDYHFNINVQLIHWPAFATNRLGHLQPLWDLLAGWMPRLRDNARHFFGVDGALMLPHAVDDRCAAVGAFWTGMIDHACTAWMAQMAWLHYRHAMDERVLREIAWPMLTGAFNGYWAMLEEVDAGGARRLSLPVSVSPEFRGDAPDAWGRDASFQLAALHFLAATLPRAAAVLGQPSDPRWARVAAELPPYTLVTPAAAKWPGRSAPRIALWQGQDLDESHRHHSHLGGIWPFGTIDPADPAHAAVVEASLHHWTHTGPGAWSGWCVPWAAILNARCGRGDAAVAWLHWWKDCFTNLGHGTLHDADFPGTSVITAGGEEIMQMDAGLGAVTAISELLVQCRGDTIAVLPALPQRWRRLRFDGIRSEGAFLIGATVDGGRVVEVRVRSLAGGRLQLAHGLGTRYTVEGVPAQGTLHVAATTAGQRLLLRRLS